MTELYAVADVIALQAPAFFGAEALAACKPGVTLVASDASLVDLAAVLPALQSRSLRNLGLATGEIAAELVAPLAAMPNVILPSNLGVEPSYTPLSGGDTSQWTAPTVSAGSDAADAVRVAFFSSRSYFTERFAAAVESHNASSERASPPVRFEMHAARLNAESAALAAGCAAVCLFVNDEGDEPVLRALAAQGVRTVLMRCAGFDKIDLNVAAELGMRVVRVPAYSPEAVAQQAVSLLLTLKWRLAAAANQTDAPPLGLQLSGTTVGVLGTGRIGYLFAMIMQGFGCTVVAYDPFKNKAIEEAGIPYLTLEEVYARADILSLHVPLLVTAHAFQPHPRLVSLPCRPLASLPPLLHSSIPRCALCDDGSRPRPR